MKHRTIYSAFFEKLTLKEMVKVNVNDYPDAIRQEQTPAILALPIELYYEET